VRPQPVDGLSGRGPCTARPSSIVGHLAGGLCRGREQNRGGREKREKESQTATSNLTKIKWKSFSKPITFILGKVHLRFSLKDSLKFTKARI